MDKKQIIKKLVGLGWNLEKGYDGLEDEDTNLTKAFNLSTTTCSGDYTKYSNGTIISELWIEYTLYPNKKSCEYIIWKKGENPANCVPEGDDFETVLEEALDDTLFESIDFPEFETVINSDNKLRNAWYDLVRLQEDYSNSLDDSFEKGQYFVRWINNCNNNCEADIYYPIETQNAKELEEKNIDEAVEEMKIIVEQF